MPWVVAAILSVALAAGSAVAVVRRCHRPAPAPVPARVR